ncbi:type I restriction enzyme HsdR N-terminal domain-containing protein [Pyrococcus sp. ST04]|uniref:type I restriction enzyme HsdR N-terminal domain-containing protein n=1 Tax=Pyrococcus sp. ST04 TaxID=1183377 RepID=UPI0002605958|nr:type I restriction enzyme HsdR N-terminal domain-containing protein [Pyrococcus sp. ST04]AFK21769.1 putative restriction endonuclease, Type I R-M system [Pyrococcus sp. ST04]
MREVIREVNSKIRKFAPIYMRNEEAVKQHLILPILKALGWNTEDPTEVRPEEKTIEGRADYALIKDNRIVAFLEAKNLSVSIDKREVILQLAKYCFDKGVEIGIVTNGRIWLILRAFSPGEEIDDRIIASIDIINEPPERVLVKFSGIRKDLIENALEFYDSLSKFEESSRKLLKIGLSERDLSSYLYSLSMTGNVVSIEEVGPSERIRGVYLFEDKWKFLPVPGGSVKDALIAILSYYRDKVSGDERKAIEIAISNLKVMELKHEKIIALIKGIEEEKGIEIRIAL